MLTSAASARQNFFRDGAGNASHKVFPETVTVGGCCPPPMRETHHRAKEFRTIKQGSFYGGGGGLVGSSPSPPTPPPAPSSGVELFEAPKAPKTFVGLNQLALKGLEKICDQPKARKKIWPSPPKDLYPAEANVHRDARYFMGKTWARPKTTKKVLNNGWRFCGGWRRLAVGGWRLAVGGP